ncbi:hypothetical protein fugu_011708 [Takifugu bimaculatus]|uniref:BPTI/Kunitz inhibitor domain-containing protein n=1 Tax=Takifugu bimaculatus TaxID=433685 RepID=A0A4Z2C8B3_9TELE|nr:hypothetical protein fugu_011708 [Takifugu bimaculatus]
MIYLLVLGITFVAFCPSQSIPDFCQLPNDEGEGSNYIFSLFYDANLDRCSPFLYKGEGGNDNRFENERDCIRNCSANAEDIYPMDDHDEEEKEEEDEPDTPIAIICGVVLGIIVVALLITVIVLAVQSEKKSSAKKAGGKKREEKTEVPLRDEGIEMS